MTDKEPDAPPLAAADYEALAAFRLALRRFLAFSEAGARKAGLTSQQHQALLAIKGGCPGRDAINVGELADQLLLKHHSAVGLVSRMAKAGLVRGERSAEDRRKVILRLTPEGERLLAKVSGHNLVELRRASRGFSRLFQRFDGER